MGRLPDFHSEVRDLRADRLSMAVGTPEENGARQEVRELVQRRRSCFARPRREMLLFVDVVEFREVPVPCRFWVLSDRVRNCCCYRGRFIAEFGSNFAPDLFPEGCELLLGCHGVVELFADGSWSRREVENPRGWGWRGRTGRS